MQARDEGVNRMTAEVKRLKAELRKAHEEEEETRETSSTLKGLSDGLSDGLDQELADLKSIVKKAAATEKALLQES